MTRSHDIFIELGIIPVCAYFSADSNLLPMDLRTDQLFQHNQKRRKKGTNDNFHQSLTGEQACHFGV